jgi:hypothetical protein
MLPRAQAACRLTVVEDAETEERFGRGPSCAKPSANMPACGENERIRAKYSIASAGRGDALSIDIEGRDLRGDRAESNRLL